eukprot:RCo026663
MDFGDAFVGAQFARDGTPTLAGVTLPRTRAQPRRGLQQKHRSWASDVGFVLPEPAQLAASCEAIDGVFQMFCSNPFESPTTDKVARLMKCRPKDVGAVADVLVWMFQHITRSGQFTAHRIRKLKASCGKIIKCFRLYKLRRQAQSILLVARWEAAETVYRAKAKQAEYLEDLRRGRELGTGSTVASTQDVDLDYYMKWVPSELKQKVAVMIYADRLAKWKKAFEAWQQVRNKTRAEVRAERLAMLQGHERRKLMGTGGGDVVLHENIRVMEQKMMATVPPMPKLNFRASAVPVQEMIQVCYHVQRLTHMNKVFDRLGVSEDDVAQEAAHNVVRRLSTVCPALLHATTSPSFSVSSDGEPASSPNSAPAPTGRRRA